MVTQKTSQPLLTIKDVEARLKITRQTVYKLRNTGQLTAVLINKDIRFTEEELERFINNGYENQGVE